MNDRKLFHFILLILGVIAGLSFIIAKLVQAPIYIYLLTKPFPILFMIIVVLINRKQVVLIWLSLIFSLMGDVLLTFENFFPGKNFFLFGLLTYFITHLLYIFAFLKFTKKLNWQRMIIPFLWIGTIGILVFPKSGSLGIPIVFYCIIIALMIWRAAAIVGSCRQKKWELFIMVGAICFGLSDSILGINRFYYPIPYDFLLVLPLYWLGQLGIILGSIHIPIKTETKNNK